MYQWHTCYCSPPTALMYLCCMHRCGLSPDAASSACSKCVLARAFGPLLTCCQTLSPSLTRLCMLSWCAVCVLQLQQVVADRPFICVKSSKDTRYAHFWATTHGGKSVRCVPFHSLAEFKAHMGFRWHKLQVGVAPGVLCAQAAATSCTLLGHAGLVVLTTLLTAAVFMLRPCCNCCATYFLQADHAICRCHHPGHRPPHPPLLLPPAGDCH